MIRSLRLLYAGEAPIDYPRWWRRAVLISAVLVAASISSFFVRGLNLGIDFEGGTSYEVRAAGTTVAEARNIVSSVGLEDARIQIVDEEILRIRSDISDPSQTAEIRDYLNSELGQVETFEQVGPTWGSEVTSKAIRALVIFFAVVAVYITIRLEWKMALGALLAVSHDILISIGIYSIFQLEVTPATIIAFLTIMGYSLYDTIVVYDKVREIVGRLGATDRYKYAELMNLALNRVTMRSINTSITSALPVISLLLIGSLLLGAATLQEFAVALLVGIVIGSYSSLFIASSLVSLLKTREPRWSEIEEKISKREVDKGPTRSIDPKDVVQLDHRSTERTSGPARGKPTQIQRSAGGAPPRPRKKRRR
ncbi:MAG TPA: protein translocase subunit SecF [Acidimicrobiales bacterium]|nr:protein translocase subunit SecF [Acidimicrobiales bacterium]